jgi:alpha-L-fucosidase
MDLVAKDLIRQAFRKLRFGMFIHFGLYSMGELFEWHLRRKKMNIKTYSTQFIHRFDPDPAGIEQWVKTAKLMGAKYLCCTSKHHDGFCLWNTKIPHEINPEYHIRNTPFFQKHQKSVLDYLFEAGKKYGIRIGLYYSVVDWSWSKKPFLKPHPHLNPDSAIHKRYVAYYLAQLHELKSLYPEVLNFWFDGYQFDKTFPSLLEQDQIYDELSSSYPDLLVVSNSGVTDRLNITGKTDVLILENADHDNRINPTIWPRNDPDQLPGELCCTFNRHWGYNSQDKSYKSPQNIADAVQDNDHKNTNTLLNFGPHWNGFILSEQAEIANQIGILLQKVDKN